MIFGLPIAVVSLILATLVGLSAPALIAAYHRFCVWCFRKTGVQPPDSPEIDADIIAVVKALVTGLLTADASVWKDPAKLEALVSALVQAALAKTKAGK